MEGSSPEQATWSRAALPYGVIPTIHRDDLLWRFLQRLGQFPSLDEVAQYYFGDGSRSARLLAGVLARHLRPHAGRPIALLEFASGYGMVTRHLSAALPDVEVTSCDIHTAAVDFVNQQLSIRAVLSQHDPGDLALEHQYDAVFALSFFSHLPDLSFGRWIAALYKAVRLGGILIFTTHGARSGEILGQPIMDKDGYWFKPDSEQVDLPGIEYGTAVTLPQYVIRKIYENTCAPIAEYQPAYWWQHQDLWVVVKQ